METESGLSIASARYRVYIVYVHYLDMASEHDGRAAMNHALILSYSCEVTRLKPLTEWLEVGALSDSA